MQRLLILLIFLLGLALGISGTIWMPRLAGPYLPGAIQGKTRLVEGQVVRKAKEQDRLLLTVLTTQGAFVATFKKRITEINLLVEQGDSVTLALRQYQPFVEDPTIARVDKVYAGP